nr:uncharacterized protein LOC111754845 [Cavia porcellus]
MHSKTGHLSSARDSAARSGSATRRHRRKIPRCRFAEPCRATAIPGDQPQDSPGAFSFTLRRDAEIPPSCLARTAALRPLSARARPRSVPFPAGGSAQLAPDAASGRPCFRPYAASIPAARSRERRGRGSRAARVTRERSLDVRVVQCVARATRGRDLAGCRALIRLCQTTGRSTDWTSASRPMPEAPQALSERADSTPSGRQR